MAIVDAEPGSIENPILVEISIPSVIGYCCYCLAAGQPESAAALYADQPTSQLDEPLSHVGCAVDARRRGQRI